MTEHRQHARAPVELQVEYRRVNSFFADYTRNISKGGTFIETATPLPVGTRFVFRLHVPSRPEPFELEGEVVHAGLAAAGHGMGVKFVWAEDAARAAFEAAVEALMSDSLGTEAAAALLGKPGGR